MSKKTRSQMTQIEFGTRAGGVGGGGGGQRMEQKFCNYCCKINTTKMVVYGMRDERGKRGFQAPLRYFQGRQHSQPPDKNHLLIGLQHSFSSGEEA